MLAALEKKNCWRIAEHRGHTSPHAVQHLLTRAKWDADAVRDDLRGYLGTTSATRPRSWSSTKPATSRRAAVRSGSSGRTPAPRDGSRTPRSRYPTYAAPRGHAFIDRALYLPKSWTEDTDPRGSAGVPAEATVKTKPRLAAEMITTAVTARVRCGWVAADEVSGADPALRARIRGHHLGYVLPIAANRRVDTPAGRFRVDQLPTLIPPWTWQRYSAGAGSKGHRYYSWAWIEPEGCTTQDSEIGQQHLLIRRNHSTGELATAATHPLGSR